MLSARPSHPLPPLHLPSPPFPSPPFPTLSLPSRTPHLLRGPTSKGRGDEGFGGALRGLKRSPSRNRIWCISALKSDIWWQQFHWFSWESTDQILWKGLKVGYAKHTLLHTVMLVLVLVLKVLAHVLDAGNWFENWCCWLWEHCIHIKIRLKVTYSY